jgi:anti-sigma factor RsiW
MNLDDELRLHAYVDGELGATESLDFERRLAEDAELRSGLAEMRALRLRIRSQAAYHEAPQRLRDRLLGRLRRQGARVPGRVAWWPALAGAAAAAGIAALVAGIAPAGLLRADRPAALVQEALDDHLRANLGAQWVEVASSDRHTVKPWVSAHLGFSPAVPDLSEQGFELLGARLGVLQARPVASLVYRRRQHMISVFVWPGAAAGGGPIEQRGYHIVRFERAGLTYWAVSDLNAGELQDLARLISASA